jgi:hypothetical protein
MAATWSLIFVKMTPEGTGTRMEFPVFFRGQRLLHQ